MEASVMIDNLIKDALHLSTSDGYVTAEWRPKILRILQRVVEGLYDYDLPWKQAGPTSLTLAANASTAEAPSGFGIVGPKGGLYKANEGVVHWKDPDYIIGWRMEARTGYPEYYSVYGVGATERPLFHFDRSPSAEYVMQLMYEKERPQLVDVADSTSGLSKIPASFHEDVIFMAAWDLLALGGGDARAGLEFSPRAQAALGRKLARYQHGKEGLQQLGDRGISDLQQW